MWGKKTQREGFIVLHSLSSTYYVWLFEKITKQWYYSVNTPQENQSYKIMIQQLPNLTTLATSDTLTFSFW